MRQNCERVDLTILGLLGCSEEMKGSGEADVEKEEESGGTEEGGYMGDIRMLGEAGREWLLTCKFGIWISRQSPPLTDRAESWRQMWMNFFIILSFLWWDTLYGRTM